jgi:hypothetical protein
MLQELVAGPAGPLVVFTLRATDVTLATFRMRMIMRGHRFVAPLIGFFEILLWVTAIGIVVNYLDSPLHVIGYAAGFATGNFLGLIIEERLALGLATIRTVVRTGGAELANVLRDAGFGVTGRGAVRGAPAAAHRGVPPARRTRGARFLRGRGRTPNGAPGMALSGEEEVADARRLSRPPSRWGSRRRVGRSAARRPALPPSPHF